MEYEIGWAAVGHSLDERGYASLGKLLDASTCVRLIEQYANPQHYRSVIQMERYRFGKGQYKYFNYPLPGVVQSLRENLYPNLQRIANEWIRHLSIENEYPPMLDDMLKRCHQHGQLRPTPLILQYAEGGFNTLHQDLYGEVYFPFQVVIVLTQSGVDHEGGELVFVEQLPRAQSRAEVISPNQGEAIVFTTNFRPVKGAKGYYRAKMKHGVSPVKKGNRYALGIIFHDAT